MSLEAQLANAQAIIAERPITNPVWTLGTEGHFCASIGDASRNSPIVYGPWEETIPNSSLVPVWADNDVGDGVKVHEITGWNVTLDVAGRTALLLLLNE